MRNVQKIIDSFGGFEALKQREIRLEVPSFMRLVIEHIGIGPHGGELVSVAHYGEQNGDPMRDPEIVFEVADCSWHPVSIQQDYVGSYREAVFVGENGKVFVRPAPSNIKVSWTRRRTARRRFDEPNPVFCVQRRFN
jgi:hypothetical protein